MLRERPLLIYGPRETGVRTAGHAPSRLLLPVGGVGRVRWLSAGFQMGLVETLSGGPWWGSAGRAQLPGPFGCLWVCRQSLFISGTVSVTRSPPFPWRPGWVGVGACDLSPAACLPSETPGVGADGAVSYGPPGPRHPPQCCCSVWAAPRPPTRPGPRTPRPSQGLVPASKGSAPTQASPHLPGPLGRWRSLCPTSPGSPPPPLRPRPAARAGAAAAHTAGAQ